MGKKKVISEENLSITVLPETTDVFGVAMKILGNNGVLIRCQDGNTRICRIRGKMKHRAWIRIGDIVLVSPWDLKFKARAETLSGVIQGGQTKLLRRKGLITI